MKTLETFLEQKEDCYKPVKVGHSNSNSYIEHQCSDDRNKTLSIKEYLNETNAKLKGIINNLKKFDAWRIQLTKVITFFSSNNTEMAPKSDNVEILIYDKAGKII